MTRVAVIEDDLPTSNQLAGWIRAARPGIEIDQWFTRDDAEAALARENYDVVLMAGLMGLAVLFYFLTRSSDSPYPLGGFERVAWFFTAAWVGVHVLGGINHKLNVLPAFVAAALIGTLASPMHSMWIMVITILAALNVYGDFKEVEAQARAIAAPEGRADAFLSQVSRNPISQSYVFVIKGGAPIEVTCQRAFILLGDYSCKRPE